MIEPGQQAPLFSLPDADGKEGQIFAFVQQKRFTFKEDIRFFTDEEVYG